MESGLYKSFSGMVKVPNELLSCGVNVLKSSGVVGSIINGYIIKYLNSTYKSIILKDDEYIVSVFNQIEKHNLHSLVCILLIIADIFKIVFLNIG